MTTPRSGEPVQPPAAGGPGWFDTHCHLNLDPLEAEADATWRRARANGVDRSVVVGSDAASSRRAVELSAALPGVWAAVGIHPTGTAAAAERAGEFEAVEELASARDPRVVAVGESGLDFYWPDSPREVQVEWLHRHVELALRVDLPLVLHIRDAYAEAAAELRRAAERGLRGIVHCFAGEAAEVEPFLDWNWPISFSGILTYPKAENVREAARRTPLELCLLETDAPWLTPRGAAAGVGGSAAKAAVNEPAHVVLTGAALAELKQVDVAELAAVTRANAMRCFGLVEPESPPG
ncbi:MAG: TatD family deoxyribonuclease [Acidobacteria bacterium]|nr:MAG: TatD family deoxyribonuclease [Acidobacteriota bacterium]